MSAGSSVSPCRRPFLRDPQHERPARGGEPVAAGRSGAAPVERQRKVAAFDLAHVDGLVEAPDRLGRMLARAARIGFFGPCSLIGRVLDRVARGRLEAEHVEALLHVLRQRRGHVDDRRRADAAG